ncbi:hypothetical protein TNCV_3857871 [Trichonephila clavipes]|nr:hypothetical protein TNCV_3857871 [Trichonephila clavipes]
MGSSAKEQTVQDSKSNREFQIWRTEKHDIFELQETILRVRLINTTNDGDFVQRHETPLRVKGDIEDVSSELDNEGYRLHILVKGPELCCSRQVR